MDKSTPLTIWGQFSSCSILEAFDDRLSLVNTKMSVYWSIRELAVLPEPLYPTMRVNGE